MSTKGRIVVIDDEVNAATALETLLREDGYEVASAHDARAGLLQLERSEPDVVLTDLRMPGMDGLELLQKVKEVRPETMVILMTAYGTVKTAVRAMKLGAEDYLGKPIDVEELEVVLQKVIEKKRLQEEARFLRERLDHKYRLDNLVGESPEMLAVFKTIRQVAASNASVSCWRRHRQGLFEPSPEQPAQNGPSSGWLRLATRDPAGERALRPREELLHQRHLTAPGAAPTAAPCSWTSRPHHAGEAPALPGGAGLERWAAADLQGRRAHRNDPPRSHQEAGRRLLPGGPLLPDERDRDPHPDAPGACRRHPAAGPPLPPQVRSQQRQGHPGDLGRGHGALAPPRLAGQRAGTGERHRTGRGAGRPAGAGARALPHPEETGGDPADAHTCVGDHGCGDSRQHAGEIEGTILRTLEAVGARLRGPRHAQISPRKISTNSRSTSSRAP